ncbi:UDP-N-acetylmuramate--L-alanine ligase [subsurface metagenome]
MNFDKKHNIYFLGIGGIGMSALAKYFYSKGKRVAGYDLISSRITDDMVNEGINIHYKQDIRYIPQEFLNKEDTIIIRTPAVPDNHKELLYFSENGFLIMKRAEILGELVNSKRGIAIAGTHGKTSVSSILAYIMHESELGCSAFLGGILKNYNSNMIIDEKADWVVAEADEFDRSFLHLHPEIALITWIDADHLDIYTTKEEIRKSYEDFVSQVKTGGYVILKKGIEIDINKDKVKVFSYSLDDTCADFYASNMEIQKGKYFFNIHTPEKLIQGISLTYPGIINIENAVAATSVAWLTGVDEQIISTTLSSFKGVTRRFDIQYQSDQIIYIDDYAHHPRELDAIISSVRKLYPEKKITGIFQPHLYTRTRDFADEFAMSLNALDELILLEIYPAREKPIKGIDSKIIYEKVTISSKIICSKSDLMKVLEKRDFEILLTLGAGDIDQFVDPIRQLIENR